MKKAQEYLESKGIHASQQRIAILDYLLKNPIHPTAEEIYEHLSSGMPTLSKTTIYNTLKLFAEKGAVSVVLIDEKTAHYDATMERHAHFLCRECGKIYDIAMSEEEMREEEKPLSALKGFEIEECQTYYKGICKKCKISGKSTTY